MPRLNVVLVYIELVCRVERARRREPHLGTSKGQGAEQIGPWPRSSVSRRIRIDQTPSKRVGRRTGVGLVIFGNNSRRSGSQTGPWSLVGARPTHAVRGTQATTKSIPNIHKACHRRDSAPYPIVRSVPKTNNLARTRPTNPYPGGPQGHPALHHTFPYTSCAVPVEPCRHSPSSPLSTYPTP